MNEQEIIRTLTEHDGNLWEKYGKRRIYWNSDSVLKTVGLDCGYYKSGNISSASLNGESISNSEAKRLLAAAGAVRFWYDLSDSQFHIAGSYGATLSADYAWIGTEFIAAMQSLISTAEASA